MRREAPLLLFPASLATTSSRTPDYMTAFALPECTPSPPPPPPPPSHARGFCRFGDAACALPVSAAHSASPHGTVDRHGFRSVLATSTRPTHSRGFDRAPSRIPGVACPDAAHPNARQDPELGSCFYAKDVSSHAGFGLLSGDVACMLSVCFIHCTVQRSCFRWGSSDPHTPSSPPLLPLPLLPPLPSRRLRPYSAARHAFPDLPSVRCRARRLVRAAAPLAAHLPSCPDRGQPGPVTPCIDLTDRRHRRDCLCFVLAAARSLAALPRSRAPSRPPCAVCHCPIAARGPDKDGHHRAAGSRTNYQGSATRVLCAARRV